MCLAQGHNALTPVRFEPMAYIFQSQLKDVFDSPDIDKSVWSLVQGGTIQDPCSTPLVEKTALVMNGQGLRQAVTVDMDLRDAK